MSKAGLGDAVEQRYKIWQKIHARRTQEALGGDGIPASVSGTEETPASVPSPAAGTLIPGPLQPPAIATADTPQIESFAALQWRFVIEVNVKNGIALQEIKRRGQNEAETQAQRDLYRLMYDFGPQRENESAKDCEARDKNARQSFIPFILENQNSFTMVEFITIGIVLRHYYDPENLDGFEPRFVSNARKLIERALTNTTPEQLFRAIHIYGDPPRFNLNLPKHYLPNRFRNMYPKWVQQNEDLITAADKDWSNLNDFGELVSFTSDPDNADRRVIGGILLHHLQWRLFKGPKNSAFDMTDEVINSPQWQSLGGDDPQQMGQCFMRLIAQNWSILEIGGQP
jgi:hypothetical protein